MGDRLSPRDVAFLDEETTTSPRHNATVEIFGSELDFDDLVALIQDRIAFVPRYRRKVLDVPGRIAAPVWVDDEHFDLGYHVRRSALPRPGNDEQLRDLVARIVSRPLDRSRPLWEIYLVEGLEGGRVALLTKTHQALVDGADTVDLGQLLLDVNAARRASGDEEPWHPHRTPSAPAMVLDAVKDALQEPVSVVRSSRGFVARRAERAGAVAIAIADAVSWRGQDGPTPFTGVLSQQRRLLTLDTDLADYRTIRNAHGGTVNDVILAVVAGGLRGWLMTRGERLGMRQVRTLVPVSVIDHDLAPTALGSQIAAHFVDLPLEEPSPVVRLHQVSYSFEAHKGSRREVRASRLTGIAGFAPATFHAVGARLAASQPPRSFLLSVTNVPGPQEPRYTVGAPMEATYPVPPLLPGHALAIGVTSYLGRVFFGVTADRDLVPDVDVLGQCLEEALGELLDTATGAREQAPRGRRKVPDSPS